MGFGKIGTKPVGNYPPSGFGLYDMCGNVSE
ncbi:MAG: SUMF1/EgtB/PvdO family nonheme iron enzyme [Proteobacteria bacterium]|nr:SUMF1/EgtB/PvdO family nonheme iron enzyme [Pseudomonadota bacterium]